MLSACNFNVPLQDSPDIDLPRARADASPAQSLAGYRAELQACRQEHGGARELPGVNFFLFGMGKRTKLLYRDGILFDAKSGSELHRWKVRRESIVPPDYTVWLETEEEGSVVLREDAEATLDNLAQVARAVGLRGQ